MSRTYRNKNSVPKGFKVRDGCGNVCYDSDGKRHWSHGDYTGLTVSWGIWHPDVAYLWGHGEQSFPYHKWIGAFLGTRKVRHESWTVQYFGGTCNCWRAGTQYRHFAKKAHRRWCNMRVHGEEWERLPQKGRTTPNQWW